MGAREKRSRGRVIFRTCHHNTPQFTRAVPIVTAAITNTPYPSNNSVIPTTVLNTFPATLAMEIYFICSSPCKTPVNVLAHCQNSCPNPITNTTCTVSGW